MSRFVFATQKVDPDHPLLGAAVPMIRALAARVDEVVVLADRVVEGALPDNCRVHSFAASSQAGRGAKLVAALAPEVATRPVAILAHMAPIYAVLAAPLARPLRVPLLLWFTQQAGGQHGRQRQGHNRRESNRNGERKAELGQWLIRSTGVTSEGDEFSGTYIFKQLSKDRIEVKVMHKVVGDTVEADTTAIMVRKASLPNK